MNRRRSSWIQKNLKDYIVPIIWWILVIILIFSMFSWWSDTVEKNTNTDIENSMWLEVKLDSDFASATVVYPWDYKKEIESDISLYKWEKVIVKEWSLSIKSTETNFKLNKLGELKYLESWDYALFSGDVWVDTKTSMNLDMRFWKISIWKGSNISVSQNEMGSTVYLISWFAEVSNLVWESTVLASWQKVTVSRSDASNNDLDLSLGKDNLDEYFLRSDWFLVNGGPSLLVKDDNEEDSEEELVKPQIVWSNKNLILFNNLLDESNVSSSSITISWNFTDNEITKIVLNWTEAKINTELKTFKFEDIDVSKNENDLVFKVYDDANDILSRFVYTVYYDLAVNNNSNNWSSSAFKVKTFNVDGWQFTFTWPTSKSTYTTYDTFVTIRWKVLAEGIDQVKVNDYKLNSFNWSTWRYHADTKFNNLWEGTNVYEIKYYSWWKIVYTNHFTIIKKSRTAPIADVTDKSTWTISWEATVN